MRSSLALKLVSDPMTVCGAAPRSTEAWLPRCRSAAAAPGPTSAVASSTENAPTTLETILVRLRPFPRIFSCTPNTFPRMSSSRDLAAECCYLRSCSAPDRRRSALCDPVILEAHRDQVARLEIRFHAARKSLCGRQASTLSLSDGFWQTGTDGSSMRALGSRSYSLPSIRQ